MCPLEKVGSMVGSLGPTLGAGFTDSLSRGIFCRNTAVRWKHIFQVRKCLTRVYLVGFQNTREKGLLAPCARRTAWHAVPLHLCHAIRAPLVTQVEPGSRGGFLPTLRTSVRAGGQHGYPAALGPSCVGGGRGSLNRHECPDKVTPGEDGVMVRLLPPEAAEAGGLAYGAQGAQPCPASS